MFDIQIHNGQIDLSLEIAQLLEEARELDLKKKENDIKMSEFREALLEAMQKHGIKKWENDIMTAIYKPETERKTVDTNALKEQGLYDSFLKTSPVKASVQVTFKE